MISCNFLFENNLQTIIYLQLTIPNKLQYQCFKSQCSAKSFIWAINGTLTGIITPSRSEQGSYSSEGETPELGPNHRM